jgi:hypothetical protein
VILTPPLLASPDSPCRLNNAVLDPRWRSTACLQGASAGARRPPTATATRRLTSVNCAAPNRCCRAACAGVVVALRQKAADLTRGRGARPQGRRRQLPLCRGALWPRCLCCGEAHRGQAIPARRGTRIPRGRMRRGPVYLPLHPPPGPATHGPAAPLPPAGEPSTGIRGRSAHQEGPPPGCQDPAEMKTGR